MSESPRDRRLVEELHELVSAALEDELSSVDAQRLDNLLASDENARRMYVAYMQSTADLKSWAQGALSANVEALPAESNESAASAEARLASPKSLPDKPLVDKSLLDKASKRPKIPSLVAAAISVSVVILLMAIIPAYRLLVHNEVHTEAPRAEGEPVATLTGWHRVDWQDGYHISRQSLRLRDGQAIALDSGLVEITYDSGAKVVIEGPAEFFIGGRGSGVGGQGTDGTQPHANSGYLKQGKLVARVDGEEAMGFTVSTPASVIVDLGTEFGVEVDPTGDTLVSVLQGQVEVAPQESPETRQVLTVGQAARVSPAGGATAAPRDRIVLVEHIPPSRFPSLPTRPEVKLAGELVVVPLSQLHPGTERVALVAGGGFSDAAGWSRVGEMFAAGPPAGVNVPNVCGDRLAVAHIDKDRPHSIFQREFELQPDTQYVLSAYLWNFGDENHPLNVNVDLNDAPGEANPVLYSSAPGAAEGCFVYQSFHTSQTGTRLTLRAFYDRFSETDNAWQHYPVGAMWDNIAITPASHFRPPTLREEANGSGETSE